MRPSSKRIGDWAREQFPDRDIVVVSDPEPVLREHNLVCVADEASDARSVLVEWERILASDGDVGFVSVGTGPSSSASSAKVDRRIMRRTSWFSVLGGLPGALALGILIALPVGLINGWGPIVVATFLGAAAWGFIAGAFFAFVRRTGWGAAYEDSQAAADDITVAIATIHADQAIPIEEAVRAVDTSLDVRVMRLDSSGRRLP